MRLKDITEKELIKHIGKEIKLIRKGSNGFEGELSYDSKRFDIISNEERYKIKDSDILEIDDKRYMYSNPSSIND